MAVTVVEPVATLDAIPCALIVAAAGFDEVHTTTPLTSWSDESLNVAVAANCFVVPTAMLEFAGVTAIETRVAAETVSDAVPLTDPLGSLNGTDNQFAFTTMRYREQPLVITGPGAGAAVTAAGVYNDLQRLATDGATARVANRRRA